MFISSVLLLLFFSFSASFLASTNVGTHNSKLNRRADSVESPFASRYTSKRVSPPPARAEGATGLMQC
jgi:hypothetical protein